MENKQTQQAAENQVIEFKPIPKEELLKMNLNQLADYMQQIVQYPYEQLKDYPKLIKEIYDATREKVLEQEKKKFIEQGGSEEKFRTPTNILDIDKKLQDAFHTYLEKEQQYQEQLEQERENNYKQKLIIIEQAKKLIDELKVKKERARYKNIRDKFQALEKQWTQIGDVPRQYYRDLMKQWNWVRREFYDTLTIYKELVEYELERNLDLKRNIIERAKLLIYKPAEEAYRELQQLHREWKEIGPVPKEERENIWNEFRQISQKINEYYKKALEKKRQDINKIIEAKQKLITVAEHIAEQDYQTFKEWREKTQIIQNLQDLWKKAGRLPRQQARELTEKFRTALDKFYDKKRQFFKKYFEQLEENYKKKLALAEKAEKLKNSTDWGRTAREFERMFEEWKKIGPVPKEKSDEVWQRFRTARLEFFRRKRQFLKEMRKKERENLQKKLQLIEKIKSLKLSDNLEENLKIFEEIEKEWNSIGFVPIKEKERINKMYREALEQKFAEVNLDSETRRRLRFEQRLKAIVQSPNALNILAREINRYKQQREKIKAEALKLKANLEKFKSYPEDLLEDFKEKLDKLNKQVKTLDEFIDKLVKEYKKLQASQNQQDSQK